MKKNVLLLLSLAVALFSSAQQTDIIKQYIETYHEIAINEMVRTGVPAAITLAQGIVESKAGQSDLVKQSNNHFGIKCKTEWTGDRVFHDDDEKNECFRVYPSAEESFRDHSDFLKNRPYYTDLFGLDPTDYKAWAKGLKKDGYATERDYPQTLIKMIEDNNLQQFDAIALQRMKQNGGADYAANNNKNNSEGPIASPGQRSAVTVPNNTAPVVAVSNNNNTAAATDNGDSNDQPAAQPDEVSPDSYPEGIFTINETRVVYVKAGTSLFALANNYNINYKTLLSFNELDQLDILSRDMLVYLERKPKKGSKDFHIVTASETIEDIAQKEGVRLESLLQYNLMHKGLQPAQGQRIYLRGISGSAPKLQKGQVS